MDEILDIDSILQLEKAYPQLLGQELEASSTYHDSSPVTLLNAGSRPHSPTDQASNAHCGSSNRQKRVDYELIAERR